MLLDLDDSVMDSDDLEEMEIEEVEATAPRSRGKKLPFDSAPGSDSNNMKLEFIRVIRKRNAHITFTEDGEVRTLGANFEEVAAELKQHPQFAPSLAKSTEPGKRLQQAYTKLQHGVTKLEQTGALNLPPYAAILQKCMSEAAAGKEAYRAKKADKRKLEEDKEEAELNVLAQTINKEAHAAKKKRGSGPAPTVGYVTDPVVEHFIKGESMKKKRTAAECNVAPRLKEKGYNTIDDLLSAGGADLDVADKEKIVVATGFKLHKPAERFLLFFDEVIAEKAPVQALASKTSISIGAAADVYDFLNVYYKDAGAQ